MNINTHDMGMADNLRELQLTVSRLEVWEEVAKLTDYTGSKSEGGDDVRDRILSTDDDLKTLSGFWDEAMAVADDRLKAMYISGSSAGAAVYEVLLEVSRSFDKRLGGSVQTALKNFFINYIVGKWFVLANKGESADYMTRSEFMMEDVLRKLYSRKRPTRPGSKIASALVLCIGMFASLLSGCNTHTVSEPVIVKESYKSYSSDSLARIMQSMLLQLQSIKQTETVSEIERIMETTVLDEHGDTMRHDKRTDRISTQILRLERENMLLQRENDSLRKVVNRIDSVAVPVPYKVEIPVPVERKLTWWQKTCINTWWCVVGALGLCMAWIFRKPIVTFARRLI